MQPATGQPTLQPGVAPQPGLPSQPDANQAANQQPAAGKFVTALSVIVLFCIQ